MFRSFWRSFDRFSLQNFENIINELQGIKVVNTFNRETIVDILQSIVEIVTYGDRHDPSIFECFMEHQVLAEFVRMLKISKDTGIEAKVLQYLSIMLQNVHSKHAIYYCFSNGHINNIITHEYEFHAGDLALYYVSLLRAISGKLNKDTICLLLNIQEGAVISFPLYTEAVRLAHHGEKMIQTAIRSLTLCIYNVSDDMVCEFLLTPPVSEYFSDLVLKMREDCIHLDSTIVTWGIFSFCERLRIVKVMDPGLMCVHFYSQIRKNYSSVKRKELRSGIDKLLDDLYYIKDLLGLGNCQLNTLVTRKLLGLLVVPVMISLLQLGKNTGVKISAVTSLYLLSCLLQVVDKKEILDSVASLILYPHLALGSVFATDDCAADRCQVKPYSKHVENIEQILYSSLESEDNDEAFECLLEPKLSAHHFLKFQWDSVEERIGIFSYIFSGDQGLQLASLMLLLILAESNDLDRWLALVFGFCPKKPETDDVVDLEVHNGIIFHKCMPQILNVLLNILGSSDTSSILIQWHAAWGLRKLVDLQRSTFNHHELHLFNVSVQLNASFHQARERLLNELNGCWFDYMLDTIDKEWSSCKIALEESSKSKDPFFLLEVAFYKQSLDGNSANAWQRMVDAVKIFVLHLQLKAYVLNGCIPNNPSINLRTTSLSSPRSIRASDPSAANFGSEVDLGSGIPCKISFSKVGLRDIFMLPVASGVSGKLLLVEKHSFRSQTGIVLAIARLAGLAPKIDEKHGTWLHLCITEFDPKFLGNRSNMNSVNHRPNAKWTLSFSDAETCEAASLRITEETCKQRSIIESILAPFLYNNSLGGETDSQVLISLVSLFGVDREIIYANLTSEVSSKRLPDCHGMCTQVSGELSALLGIVNPLILSDQLVMKY